jgi:hypothetical protein
MMKKILFGFILLTILIVATSPSALAVGFPDYDRDDDGICDSHPAINFGQCAERPDNDLCPNTPEGEDVDFFGCSDSQVDSDLDGICNPHAPTRGPSLCENFRLFHGPIADNCPLDVNPDQEDDDGDERGNICDNCPADVNPNQEDADGDGLGDVCDQDDDNDGIGDSRDQCPNTEEGAVVNFLPINIMGCANNQLDDDNDGVPNTRDLCINTPEDEIANEQGCSPEQLFIDTDNDGIQDHEDNCPLVANEDQANNDNDRLGDVCDPDDDNDLICDEDEQVNGICILGPDNCPLVPNALGQNDDLDNDGVGDACDERDDREQSVSIDTVEVNNVEVAQGDEVTFEVGETIELDITVENGDFVVEGYFIEISVDGELRETSNEIDLEPDQFRTENLEITFDQENDVVGEHEVVIEIKDVFGTFFDIFTFTVVLEEEVEDLPFIIGSVSMNGNNVENEGIVEVATDQDTFNAEVQVTIDNEEGDDVNELTVQVEIIELGVTVDAVLDVNNNDTESANFVFNLPVDEDEVTYTFNIVASGTPDNEDEEIAREFSFTVELTKVDVVVEVNHAPVWDEVEDQTANVDEEFSLTFKATDEDGDELVYRILQFPGGALDINGDGTVTLVWTPVEGNLGDNVFEIQVVDIEGTTDEVEFTITVVDPNVDADNDGVVDVDDECANTVSGDVVDANGCSDAQKALQDDDNDGVNNGNDICEGHDDNADKDNDNIPDGCDADIDGDGVDNDLDNCPIDANPADENGVQEDNDNDNLGAACDDDDNQAVVVPPGDAPVVDPQPNTKFGEHRKKLDDLRKDFDDLEKDGDDQRKDLFDARDDRDDRKINKHEGKLKKTLNKLKDLLDDIEKLEDKIRDDRDDLTDDEQDELEIDLKRLDKDTDDEIDALERLLGLRSRTPIQFQQQPQASSGPVPSQASVSTGTEVLIQPFTGQIPNRNQVVEAGMSFRGMAWAIGGIIIAIAIIVFLMALLLL